MTINYWLVKTEEDVYPIDKLKSDKETLWDGVRNYQARNYLKQMKKGDIVFIYHSNCKEPGIVGLGEISKEAIPDPLQFVASSDYYDPKSTKESPRWFSPTIKYKKTIPNISLETLRQYSWMKDSPLTRTGNRLSVLSLTERQGLEIIKSS